MSMRNADYRYWMDADTQMPLEKLLHCQNQDGGWGYYAGRSSWTEPTAWAWIALHRDPDARDAASRAWNHLRSCQRPGGGISPKAGVSASSWVTALFVTAHVLARQWDGKAAAALDWLLDAHGAEGALWRRWIESVRKGSGYNPDFYGWSWYPESSSWLEPTVHSLVALKLSGRLLGPGHRRSREIRRRVELGEAMLLDRRCADGGWNYGARIALGEALPSYPECSGQALFALQGREEAATAAASFLKRWSHAKSPMARAWLRLGLRTQGIDFHSPGEGSSQARDVTVLALEAIGAPDGNHRLLKTGGWNEPA